MAFILVVEDNEANLELITTVLEDEGHELAIARDGAAGLSMTYNLMPDIVLMDVSLPLLNGLDATGVLKREARTRDIPIIALTAHAMRGDRELCLSSGCDDYETKPLATDRLLAKITKYVEERSPEFVRLVEQARAEAKVRGSVTQEAVEEMREALARSEAGRTSLQAELETTRTELETARRESRAREGRAAAVARQQLEDRTRSFQRHRADLQKRLTAAERERDEALSAAERAREQQRLLARAQEEQDTIHASLIEHIADLETAAEAAAGNVTSADIETLEATYQAQIAEMEERHQAAIAAAEEQAARAAKRRAARARRTAAERQLQTANETITALRAQLDESERRQSAIPVDARILTAELGRKEDELMRARAALSELQIAVRHAVDSSFQTALYGASLGQNRPEVVAK